MLFSFYRYSIGQGYRFPLSDTGFYVKNGIGEDILPAVSVGSILQHPRNKERQKLFEPMKDWEYIHV